MLGKIPAGWHYVKEHVLPKSSPKYLNKPSQDQQTPISDRAILSVATGAPTPVIKKFWRGSTSQEVNTVDKKAFLASVQKHLDEDNFSDYDSDIEVNSSFDSTSEISEEEKVEKLSSTASETGKVAESKFKFLGIGKTKAAHLKDRVLFLTPKRQSFSLFTFFKKKDMKSEFRKTKQIHRRLVSNKLKESKLTNAEKKLVDRLVANKKYTLSQLLDMNSLELSKALKINENLANRIIHVVTNLDRDGIDLRAIGANLSLDYQEVEGEALRMLDPTNELGVDYVQLTKPGVALDKFLARQRVPVVAEGSVDSLAGSDDDPLEPQKVLTLEDAVQLGVQLLKGINDLHSVNYLHGDLKLDNIVVFPQEEGPPQLKIIDFGKTAAAGFKQGNPRITSPEGISSRREEAYGCGMLLIALLENHLLDDGDILPVNEQDKVNADAHGRVGIEKFVLLHKAFPHRNFKTLKNKVQVLGHRIHQTFRQDLPFAPKYTAAQNAMEEYIDALGGKLKEGLPEEEKARIDDLMNVIKDLTKSSPSERILVGDAIELLES